MPLLRVVRPAPNPLGLYIRSRRNDQGALTSYLATGGSGISGVVLDAKQVGKHDELLLQAQERKLDIVLDPQTQAMATIGGYASSMDSLPWGSKRPHTKSDFARDLQRRQIAESIAQFAIQNGFTQVLAPTHLLSGPDDPWLEIDLSTTNALRSALDRHGASKMEVIYSLAISYDTFRTPSKRAVVLDYLRQANVDGIWLNVEGCGSSSNGTRVTRYADAAADFHSLGKPLIADHTGGLAGLALLAFGAVGGLAHGITIGERVSTTHWLRRSTGDPFALPTRVYLPALDWHLLRVDAEKLFETGAKAKATFGCHNSKCCPRGITGMLQAPARHFLFQRAQEIGGLSTIPESLRPRRFLEEHVRTASDRALLATKLSLPEPLAKKASVQSKRLDLMRIELGEYSLKHRNPSFAKHPLTRAAREGRG